MDEGAEGLAETNPDDGVNSENEDAIYEDAKQKAGTLNSCIRLISKYPFLAAGLTSAAIGLLAAVADVPHGPEVALTAGLAAAGASLRGSPKEKVGYAVVGAASGIAATAGLSEANLPAEKYIKPVSGLVDDVVTVGMIATSAINSKLKPK